MIVNYYLTYVVCAIIIMYSFISIAQTGRVGSALLSGIAVFLLSVNGNYTVNNMNNHFLNSLPFFVLYYSLIFLLKRYIEVSHKKGELAVLSNNLLYFHNDTLIIENISEIKEKVNLKEIDNLEVMVEKINFFTKKATISLIDNP